MALTTPRAMLQAWLQAAHAQLLCLLHFSRASSRLEALVAVRDAIMRSLVDQNVLITGGAAGIGYALAQEALRRGARVSLVDVTDGAAAVAQLKAEAGGAAYVACFKADVSDFAQAGLWLCLLRVCCV